MSPNRFPFGGIPVYNPHSLSKSEAIAQFHAREGSYNLLLDLLRTGKPPHVLVIGTRGMGKTTLLQRVRYGIEDDEELSNRYLILTFPEEQYNVNRLDHFYRNAVDALADAFERLSRRDMVDHVERFAGTLASRTPRDIEEDVPDFLASISMATQKHFLLLVDNSDRLIETIDLREQWGLRELLSARNDITFIGATSQASEGLYGSDRAFFEFFQIHRLGPLSLNDVRNLLLKLSESVEERLEERGSAKRRITTWLSSEPARIRTLFQLTGGNPRTTVLLFHLVLDGLDGGAREYLEQLLDQVTPNYKGRIDELPTQAQQVLDAVSNRWDPVTAQEVASDTGLETNIVSTQLTRLVRQGILEKADPGDSKKALYQVSERFFNIWYLMRASRRARAKLRWFVEFLRVFFDSAELEEMTQDRLRVFRYLPAMQPKEIENMFAYMLASGKSRSDFEDYLRREGAQPTEEWGGLWDLVTSTVPSLPADATQNQEDKAEDRFEEIGYLRGAVRMNLGNAELWCKLGKNLREEGGHAEEAEQALRKAIELRQNYGFAWRELGRLLTKLPGRAKEAENALRLAIDLDAEDADAWTGLGACLLELDKFSSEAEAAFRKAIELKPDSVWAWQRLGDMLRQMDGRASEAESTFRKALQLDPQYPYAWASLGALLGEQKERRSEAEAAYHKAVEIKPDDVWVWFRLGDMLRQMDGRASEAESTLRKALQLDPQYPYAWASLGTLLGEQEERRSEAEAAYRKALEIKPDYDFAWYGFGYLLGQMPDCLYESEDFLRGLIANQNEEVGPLLALAQLMSCIPHRKSEAEDAFRKAIQLDPENRELWGRFGVFLACIADKPKEAEHAFRKAIVNKKDTISSRNLGVLLFCELNRPEEAISYLGDAHTHDPGDPISAAVLVAALHGSGKEHEYFRIALGSVDERSFWNEMLELCRNYAHFGKILQNVCDLCLQQDSGNLFARLYLAVAHAQIRDFPRALVMLEDAFTSDPIEFLSYAQDATMTILAAAVRCGRASDCLTLIEKRNWKDAWRPIYEALRAVEYNSAEYLKRIAVEIRLPAIKIARRIAPELPLSQQHPK